jgi:hypothetical protein
LKLLLNTALFTSDRPPSQRKCDSTRQSTHPGVRLGLQGDWSLSCHGTLSQCPSCPGSSPTYYFYFIDLLNIQEEKKCLDIVDSQDKSTTAG